MNQREAYNYGKNNGYNIAECNRSDYNLADEDQREKFIDDMLETESENFRQYTPFEFFAHDVNCSKYSDELWDKYDNGVYEGIKKLVKEEVNLLKNNHE